MILAREGHGAHSRKDDPQRFPASVATPAALGQAQSTPTPALDTQHDFLKGNSEAVRKAVRCFSLFYLALLIYEQLEQHAQHISHRRRIDHLPATVRVVGGVCAAPKILKRFRRLKNSFRLFAEP
nr:hypothetical protein M3O59_019420 [Xanthomonas nasturtii]